MEFRIMENTNYSLHLLWEPLLSIVHFIRNINNRLPYLNKEENRFLRGQQLLGACCAHDPLKGWLVVFRVQNRARGLCVGHVNRVDDLAVVLGIVRGRIEHHVLHPTDSQAVVIIVALCVEEKPCAPVVKVGSAS